MRLSDQIRAVAWAFVDDRRDKLASIADEADRLDTERTQAVNDLAAVRALPNVAMSADAKKAQKRKTDIFNAAQDWAARDDGTPNYIVETA